MAVDFAATRPAIGDARHVTVEFRDVWFAYDLGHVARDEGPAESPEWVLRGVSFKVEPGRTLALVGHTGAGKTTIINLLLRFYDPNAARFVVNGVDIRSIPLPELRGLIGYVQQDIFLFAGDVLSNIRLSNPIPEEDVALAASRVRPDRIIRRLPHGYAQILGERGAVDQRRRATDSVVCARHRGESRACSCSTRRRALSTARSRLTSSVRSACSCPDARPLLSRTD
jgi:ATP-binding cassette subfamily B protein